MDRRDFLALSASAVTGVAMTAAGMGRALAAGMGRAVAAGTAPDVAHAAANPWRNMLIINALGGLENPNLELAPQ